jgi:putative ABC transport system substrate-binding protein
MRRRDFLTFLGNAAAAWPLDAQAQQARDMRRVGILLPADSTDTQYQAWLSACLQTMQQSGWTADRNVKIDVRWTTTNETEIHQQASELVGLTPDVILAHGISTVAPLHQMTRTIPIVFVVVAEPIAAGFVHSLARPGGNATGFMTEEYGIAGKRLELLKQVAPDVKRAAVLLDPTNSASVGELAVIQAAAPEQGVEVTPIGMSDAGEIERTVASFAQSANGGVIVAPSGLAPHYRDLIVMLTDRYRLPAIYFQRLFSTAGGLISYGPDFKDEYRRAAGYIDRILKGEKPADLPVQAPIKYELIVNLKTAMALGLTIPTTLVATADEVLQ